MPLSWNEIRSRAIAFSKEWGDETSERAEAQSFWNAFFTIFGIDRRRVTAFEKQVGMSRAGHALKNGRIDAFWKGVLLIEHKSAGQNLERAFAQAVDYFDGLPERDLPRYVLVSDFRRLRLSDFETGEETEFALKDLHKHIRRFGFIAGYQAQVIKPQDPVNLRAAERMGRLHDALDASGYDGHALEVMLVRLLFCLFADDTGIFQPAQAFRAWVEERTAPDGSDLEPQLAALFQVLDTPDERRPKTLDEQLRAFPYVNGRLFEAALPLASFNAVMREGLRDRLERHQPGDLRRAVPEHHGHQGAPQSRRALHQRGEHPQADQAALSRRTVGRVRKGQAQPQPAVRVPQEAAHAQLPGPTSARCEAQHPVLPPPPLEAPLEPQQMQVRDGFTQREGGLVQIERALEQHRQQLGGGAGRGGAGLHHLGQPLVVVLLQLVDARVQAGEGPTVRRQHQRVRRHGPHALDGSEVERQRVGLGFQVDHHHVGADARQHHVAGDEHARRRLGAPTDVGAVQRDVLGRMAVAGVADPLVRADRQPLAVH